jgi:hypothetical protein
MIELVPLVEYQIIFTNKYRLNQHRILNSSIQHDIYNVYFIYNVLQEVYKHLHIGVLL